MQYAQMKAFVHNKCKCKKVFICNNCKNFPCPMCFNECLECKATNSINKKKIKKNWKRLKNSLYCESYLKKKNENFIVQSNPKIDYSQPHQCQKKNARTLEIIFVKYAPRITYIVIAILGNMKN